MKSEGEGKQTAHTSKHTSTGHVDQLVPNRGVCVCVQIQFVGNN